MRYQFGPFHLDSELPLLLRDGQTVPISPRALAGLVLLIQSRHTAVSRRELMDSLWPNAFVEEGSLAQLVSSLRKVLAPEFPDQSPIQTIPKTGYRFVAEVTESAESVVDLSKAATPNPPAHLPIHEIDSGLLSASVFPATTFDSSTGVLTPSAMPDHPSDEIAEPSRTPRRFRHWRFAACGAVVLLLAVPLGVRSLRVHRRPSPVTSSGQAARYTVAVLPFQNLSAQPESAWVSVATQEMLATDLRMSRSFRVSSGEDVNRALAELRMTASAEPAPDALRRLGNDLDCDHAVTGAYLLRDGQLRLDVRLVNLRTGATEQESSYDQPEKTLLPMLSRVREQMAHTLGVPQESKDAAPFAEGLNPDAYRLFAEGVAGNNRYDSKVATRQLQQAIALEPSFPLAHLALSTAWTQQGEETEAAAEAERAMNLAGSLPREQQLVIQARVQSAKHHFPEAAELYRTLFRFYPDNPEYGRQLVQSLSTAGRNADALREAQALVAAPAVEDPRTDSVIADAYSNAGDWPKSLEWSRRGAAESRRRGATILYERLLTTESQAEYYLKQYELAESQTREALTLAQQYGDTSGELRAFNRLGQIATAREDWATASTALLAALEKERHLDQRQREVHTLITLSKLNQSRGDLAQAYRYSVQAIQLSEATGIVEAGTEARLQKAVLEARMGDRNAALRELKQVTAQAGTIQDAYLQNQANQALASLKTKTQPANRAEKP